VDFIRGVAIISDRILRMPLWPAGRVGCKSGLMRWGVTWQSISWYACIGVYFVCMQCTSSLTCARHSDHHEVEVAATTDLSLDLQAQSTCSL